MRSKKKLVLVPSAYSHKAMDDIGGFIPLYKDSFDVYVINDDDREEKHVVVDGVHYVKPRTSLANYLIYTADYIIDAGTVTGSSKYSASQTRISVWHGTPYKKMFVDLAREHIITALDYCYGINMMLSPSEWYTDRFLRQSMLYTGKVLECGIPKTDRLFADKEAKSRLKEELGIHEGKKVLLYAPTFRERGEVKLPFDVVKMQSALGAEWVIVVKLHYLNTLVEGSGVIDATQTSSVDQLLAITDLLITDYSSLMFDYSVLGHPCLFYQYDKDEYEQHRSFMFELSDYVPPDDIVFTEQELLARLAYVDRIGANLQRMRDFFYPHQEPHATRALVEKLHLDSSQREVSEVIFLVNELNQIGGVHTFATNLARELKRRYGAKLMIIGNRELDYSKSNAYIFDQEGLFDIRLSVENNLKQVKAILKNTDGYVIACQYGVHRKLQRYLKGRKSVLMFHGDTKDVIARTLYSVHLDGYNKKKVRNYRRLLLLTKANCELLKKHLEPEVAAKTTYIENGLDFSDGKNMYSESGEFAFVSRLDPDKNPLEAIDIFASDKLNPAYKLHVYGDGSLRDTIEQQIQEENLSDRIILHGYVEDKDEIYRNKQGVISISLTEGLPYTILESIKYGIPVYAYNSFTAARDMITEQTGVLIEPGDQAAFIDALNSSFDYRNFHSAEIIARFSNDTVLEKWKQLFGDLDEEALVEQREKAASRAMPHNASMTHKKKKRKAKASARLALKRWVHKRYGLRGAFRYAELSARWHNMAHSSSVGSQPLVSVIMPYYENSVTVAAAVRSVAKSGYPNYEIILVNDGSADNPMNVLKHYGKIRYFYKENGGLSDARNFGIERANGKYVLYLDSDDLMYPRALNRLVNKAERNDLAMVCGKTIRYYVGKDKEETWCPGVYSKPSINSLEMRHELVDDTISTGKLYRRDMLLSTGTTFKKGFYEDILYTGELYAKLDRVGIITAPTQVWMVYGIGTSITRRMPLDLVRARIKNIDTVFSMNEATTKVYLTRQFIRQHAVVSLNDYLSYTEEERRELFELLKHSMELRKDYVLDRLITQPSKKRLYRSLLDNDYDAFSLIAEGFSEKYLAFYRADAD